MLQIAGGILIAVLVFALVALLAGLFLNSDEDR